MPARLAPDQSRGYLVPLGASVRGAGQTGIFKRLFAILGQRPRVAIVAAAADEVLADDLDARLIADGAGHVQRIVLAQRVDSEAQAALAAVEHADLVVLCAELPLRLSTLLGGTALARLLRRRNADGMAVGGIGGGASVLPEHMLGGSAQG
ncbi:MAG: hypothetical protein JSS13_02750, partial [Proteobacteria bacterium]|nr:hypothetical protein [Pseudomonadota bacterium]